MSDREVNGLLALVAGLAALAGPRRTRPLAAFLYGLWLSRAHGAGRVRIEAELARLFDQRESVRRDVDELVERLDALERALPIRRVR